MKKSLTKTQLSKKSLRAKADKLVSQYARLLGRCEWCGSIESLNWSHGVTRGWGSLRYEGRNWACLCASCHRKVDQNFTFKWQVWESIKGKEAVEWLKKQRPQPSILTPEFYEKVIKKYE